MFVPACRPAIVVRLLTCRYKDEVRVGLRAYTRSTRSRNKHVPAISFANPSNGAVPSVLELLSACRCSRKNRRGREVDCLAASRVPACGLIVRENWKRQSCLIRGGVDPVGPCLAVPCRRRGALHCFGSDRLTAPAGPAWWALAASDGGGQVAARVVRRAFVDLRGACGSAVLSPG